MFVQNAPDLAARGVPGVENAPDRMGRFSAQRRPPVAATVEAGAPVDQFAHVAHTLFDENRHRRLVAQSIAGAHRVGRMQCRAVIVAKSRSDAPLCVSGIPFARLRFGQNEHTAGAGQADGGP